MGISLYYTAERPAVITTEEQAAIDEIIDRFQADFPFPDSGESFYVYDYDADEPERIFYGATGLPMDDTEDTIAACMHWAACLTEIRHVLHDAQWDVHLDDYDLTWNDDTGWCLE